MTTTRLPTRREMLDAFSSRDASYEGVFMTAVRTTGVFCRPTCTAKKPRPDNVEFFPSAKDALLAGYRPCKRCRPLEQPGGMPEWIMPLLRQVDADPSRRWTDADIRSLDIDPNRVRRWFRDHHGMTFHAYLRARRLGLAMGRLQQGADLTRTAYEHGFDSLSGFRDAFQRIFGDAPGRARRTEVMTVTRVTTPLGPMIACANDDGLALLEFADRRALETQLRRVGKRFGAVMIPGEHEWLDRIAHELSEYFAGRREVFDVPLLIRGTPFQEAVWKGLGRIPYGETDSYEGMARRVGRPTAFRAVGRTNGDNPLAIVVPCHRVVRTDGTLCGYGGGLWRKQYLLDLERGARSS